MKGYCTLAIRTKVETINGDNVLTITLTGRFDVNSYKEFRLAYMEKSEPITQYVIDMSGVESMDISAMGMILMLRESVGDANAKIKNCLPEVERVLKAVDFHTYLCVE